VAVGDPRIAVHRADTEVAALAAVRVDEQEGERLARLALHLRRELEVGAARAGGSLREVERLAAALVVALRILERIALSDRECRNPCGERGGRGENSHEPLHVVVPPMGVEPDLASPCQETVRPSRSRPIFASAAPAGAANA